MANRLRKLHSEKISFFAFQDIITSVTGVLILITLLLAILTKSSATNPSPSSSSIPPTLLTLQTNLHQLQTNNLQRLQTLHQINDFPNDLVPMLSEHQTLLTQLQSNLTHQTTLHLHTQALSNTLHTLQNKTQALQRQNLQEQNQNRQLQEQLQKFQRAQNAVRLIPDQEAHERLPILLILSNAQLQITPLHAPETTQVHEGLAWTSQLRTLLSAFSPAQHHLVFYVKPSGVPNFQFCLSLVKEMGFSFGYDALAEADQIQFGSPLPPSKP